METIFVFSLALRAEAAHFPTQLLSFRNCKRTRFNACRLTMHCYYTGFMFTSCVIWPKESLQSERLMQNLCLYMAVSVSGKSILRAWCTEMTECSLTDTKSTGDWEPLLLFKEFSVTGALIIVCSNLYISLSLGLFFDNNYDCGV